ncbi:MAG: UPF0236 family transposase-like protein [Candidatus Zixiibacteriota bacterium]
MAEIVIDLQLKVKIAEKGLNINNLLYQMKKFMPQLFFAILKAIFSAVEESTIAEMKRLYPQRYVRNGRQRTHRQIRTSYGMFQYQLARVWDKQTQKTLTPLCSALDLPRYRRHIAETGEGGVGLVCHLSYRRSAKEIDRILGTGMSKSTLHRQLQEFADQMCSWPNLKKVPYRFLMVDGTEVRLQKRDGEEPTRRAEMRWALASVGEKHKFDLVGVWIDKSWQKIHQDLSQRMNYSLLEVLLSDGGPGIEENLLAEGMRHQRCTWHGKRDFPYILYLENLKKPQQKEFKDKLKSIPAMQLTRGDLELLTPQDLEKVKAWVEKTKQGFQELIQALPEEKYPKARVYIQNLSRSVSTFFDFWLDKGVWIPLNINAAENSFSQVKNRIWSVGRRWGELGLMNWLLVVVNKIFFPSNWNQLWSQYLNINSNLQINLTKVRYQWR